MSAHIAFRLLGSEKVAHFEGTIVSQFRRMRLAGLLGVALGVAGVRGQSSPSPTVTNIQGQCFFEQTEPFTVSDSQLLATSIIPVRDYVLQFSVYPRCSLDPFLRTSCLPRVPVCSP